MQNNVHAYDLFMIIKINQELIMQVVGKKYIYIKHILYIDRYIWKKHSLFSILKFDFKNIYYCQTVFGILEIINSYNLMSNSEALLYFLNFIEIF